MFFSAGVHCCLLSTNAENLSTWERISNYFFNLWNVNFLLCHRARLDSLHIPFFAFEESMTPWCFKTDERSSGRGSVRVLWDAREQECNSWGRMNSPRTLQVKRSNSPASMMDVASMKRWEWSLIVYRAILQHSNEWKWEKKVLISEEMKFQWIQVIVREIYTLQSPFSCPQANSHISQHIACTLRHEWTVCFCKMKNQLAFFSLSFNFLFSACSLQSSKLCPSSPPFLFGIIDIFLW